MTGNFLAFRKDGIANLRRQHQLEPLHQVIERVRLANYIGHWRRDRRNMRNSPDYAVSAPSEDRRRDFRQRNRFLFRPDIPSVRRVNRTVANDFYAVVAGKGDEGAHAASSSSFGGWYIALTNALICSVSSARSSV